MANATMALTELAEKGAHIDALRQMVQFMAQRLMELDVEGRCGAAYDEKNPTERLNPEPAPARGCVKWDEKTANQALVRKDPVLPLSPGRAERYGFKYFRHGTLSL